MYFLTIFKKKFRQGTIKNVYSFFYHITFKINKYYNKKKVQKIDFKQILLTNGQVEVIFETATAKIGDKRPI